MTATLQFEPAIQRPQIPDHIRLTDEDLAEIAENVAYLYRLRRTSRPNSGSYLAAPSSEIKTWIGMATCTADGCASLVPVDAPVAHGAKILCRVHTRGRRGKAEKIDRGIRGRSPEGTSHIKRQGGGHRSWWTPYAEWHTILHFADIVNAGCDEGEPPIWDIWKDYDGPREVYECDRIYSNYINPEEEVAEFQVYRKEVSSKDSAPPRVPWPVFAAHRVRREALGELWNPGDGIDKFLLDADGKPHRVSADNETTQQYGRLYRYIYLRERRDEIYGQLSLTSLERDTMRKLDDAEIKAMLNQSSVLDFETWDKRDLLKAWRDRKPRASFRLRATDAPQIVALDVEFPADDLTIHPIEAAQERHQAMRSAFEDVLPSVFVNSVNRAYESAEGDADKKAAMLAVHVRYGEDFSNARDSVRLVEFSQPGTRWQDISDDTVLLAMAIVRKKSVNPNEIEEILQVFPDEFRRAWTRPSAKTSSSAPIVEGPRAA